MSDVLVEVDGVSKRFCRSLKRSLWYGVRDVAGELTGRRVLNRELRPGEFWAVDDVSFKLRRGECVGLIGPNGAGKSTLLKVLNGLIKPDRGKITMRGRIGALIELGTGFNPILTGRENIYNNAAVLGMGQREVGRKLDAIIDFAELPGQALDAPVHTYSSGMKVRLGFAVAAQMEPDVLLVDEVLAVGDVGFRLKCFNEVQTLIENGTATVLVSHDLNSVSRVCKRGIVLNTGALLLDGEVGTAVSAYEHLMIRGMRTDTGNFGDNEAESTTQILLVEPLDNDFRPKDVFESGESVTLRVQYSAGASAANCTALFRIGCPRIGDFASFTNHTLRHVIPVTKGRGTYVVRLHHLPLLAGRYYVRAALFDEGHNCLLDNQEMACTFEVTSPAPDVWSEFHPVRLRHSWIAKGNDTSFAHGAEDKERLATR